MGKPRGGKAAVKDFEKKKQKLGKKKLAPTNSTSTQFKARSVVLPDQTIGAERGEPVSHRQLTLGELVGQLKHYSADVRHDAVRGLLELVTRHPEVLAPRAAELLDAALPALTDGDGPRGDARAAARRAARARRRGGARPTAAPPRSGGALAPAAGGALGRAAPPPRPQGAPAALRA